MTLLTASPIFKPFSYPWAYDAWLTQQRIHWLPEEVTLGDDVRDWKSRLTAGEKQLLTQIFRFFTQSDIEVNNCYMQHYGRVFKPTEVRMMLAAFSNMETIHIAAYAHLIDTLGMPDTEYQAFLSYKEMKDKYDYMHTFNTDTPHDIACTLAAFGAFTEGLQLFASFAILLNFQRFGKMKGMGQIVAWSARDESLHCESIIRLYHTFLAENAAINKDRLTKDLYNICDTIVNMECAFIDLVFAESEIEGLTAIEMKKYVKFIANRRLNQLKLVDMYNIEENPLLWMETILNGVEHVNFFENRVTEYSRASTVGNWDDAFE
jgi:ribonucleoside-diphosphate reductase beta chain